MDARRVSRLVERTAVGEGERDGVSEGVSEGEGGEGFYMAQTGRSLDLLVTLGGRNVHGSD
jgi:hypothetical protein